MTITKAPPLELAGCPAMGGLNLLHDMERCWRALGEYGICPKKAIHADLGLCENHIEEMREESRADAAA